jgi:hypothetical protein
MLADITVKVSEFQASGRKLEQQLIYLRAIQKSVTQEEGAKLRDIFVAIDEEVDKLHVFMENDKKSCTGRMETAQTIEGKR